jgi:dCTP deaminase
LVLSKADILKYLERGTLRIEPFRPEAVAQVSVDLRLGRKFTIFKKPDYLPAIHVDHSLWHSADLWEHVDSDTYRLEPGAFVLAQTFERVTIPADLVGLVEGRSSWARVGVSIHVTAPKIDPGFSAQITLEMFNFGRVAVDLRAERDQPAQLILLRVSTPLKEDELYGQAGHDVFQGQTLPVPSVDPKKGPTKSGV